MENGTTKSARSMEPLFLNRALGTCCVCRWEADIRSSSCIRRRALRVRLVKPGVARGSSSWSLSTSRVTVRTVSHNKVASVG